MIILPEGWRRVSAVGSDVYASPDRRWQVRSCTRRTPLARVHAIATAALAELAEWRTHAAAPRERLVTFEGEHAFGIALTGAWLGRDARRYLGVIYGDDSYDTVDVIALGSEPIETAGRALVRGATLRLGMRPRRYFYARPGDWHGHATGLTAHWFPPQFPARPSAIVVYPANPTNEQPQTVVDAMIEHHKSHGAELVELAPPQPIAARDGLEGIHWTFSMESRGAPAVARDLVIYARGAFTYALQLDSVHAPDPAAREVFAAIARSVEPVPVATGGAPEASSAAFSHLI